MENDTKEVKSEKESKETNQKDSEQKKKAAAAKPRRNTDMDFSDIDNLDRATEYFMNAQRKALGARRVEPSFFERIGKRGIAVAAIAVILISAVAGGIAISSKGDDALRKPQPAATTAAATTTTITKQEAEPADAPAEDNAAESLPVSEAAADTSLTSATSTTATSSTLPGQSTTSTSTTSGAAAVQQEQPQNIGQPEQPAATELQQIATEPAVQPVVAPVTTPRMTTTTTRTTTRLTTTTRATTTTKATTRTTTTTKATTKATTRMTTTTPRPTTTTTTTTTTTLPKPNVMCQGAEFAGFEREGDLYVYTIQVSLINRSSTASSAVIPFMIKCTTNGSFDRVESLSSDCSLVSYSTPNATMRYTGSVGGNGSATFNVKIKATAPITRVTAALS